MADKKTPNDIVPTGPTRLSDLIDAGHIYDAINMLRHYSEKSLTWEITDEINRVEKDYGYLLQYAVEGVDDPKRLQVYDDIKERLRVLSDTLSRTLRLRRGGTVYADTVRSSSRRSLEQAIDAYRRASGASGAFAQAQGEQAGTNREASLLATEAREDELFDTVWTAWPLHTADVTMLQNLIDDPTATEHVKLLTVSALALGAMEYYDERRALLLTDIYRNYAVSNPRLALTALTGLMLVLYISRRRAVGNKLIARLKLLRDLPTWHNDIRSIFLEFIRTRDTDRITRTLHDEIVPQMMKLKPEIDKTIRNADINTIDIHELEQNPEWKKMLDDSGITDKMKELTELQEEGGDVMMGTFAHLKSFPFFFKVASWFTPFRPDHSSVLATGVGAEKVGEMLDSASFICDSDKFSFVFALKGVPDEQRRLMMSQFSAQNVAAAEMSQSEMGLSTEQRRNIVNKYVQNLYRFFRLFRRKEDFKDPFAGEINLTQVPALEEDFVSDADTLRLVAEFYFSHGYYKEALEVFRLAERVDFPDASTYQKMGYCLQQEGDTEGALALYEKAELLDASSEWTLRRIAMCKRLLGDYDGALGYFRRLAESQPESASLATQQALCLMALRRYNDALRELFKADYLRPGDARTLRRIAWAQLMAGEIDNAAARYEALLADNPEPDDHLNAGHLELARERYRDAIGHYVNYVAATGGTPAAFNKAMQADEHDLRWLNINPDMLPLIIDAVNYSSRP